MASLTRWTWVWTSSGRMVKDREVWHAAVLGVAKNWTLLSYWTRTEILEWVSIPMDRGTWWAIVHGVTKTQTQLKWLTLHPSAQSIRSGFSGSAGKESACNVGDLGSVHGLGRSPGEGKGYPLQYSALEIIMNCIVRGVTKSQTWLSNFHFSWKNVFMFYIFCLRWSYCIAQGIIFNTL